MKKLFISILLLVSIQSFAEKDSIPIDTVKILSVNDINRIASTLKTKATVQQYEDFMQIMQYIITTKENEEKQKAKQ